MNCAPEQIAYSRCTLNFIGYETGRTMHFYALQIVVHQRQQSCVDVSINAHIRTGEVGQ